LPSSTSNRAPPLPPNPNPKRARREGIKQVTLINILRATDGATTEEIMAATVWQAHTVRGAMAGALKKRLGLEVTWGEGRGSGSRV
jgi:hypothetical protein